MEMGAFGLDVLMYGYPNGATFAYIVYLVAFIFTYKFGKKKTLSWDTALPLFDVKNIIESKYEKSIIRKRFKISMFILFFFLFIMLFVFGGINVVAGDVLKGEFRSSFGFFGAIPFYITKLFAPAILAYLTAYYVIFKSKVKGIGKYYLINVILCFFIGMTWGFKSTGIMVLLPTMIIFWQKISFKKLAVIAMLGLSIFTAAAVLYDNREVEFSEIKSTVTDFSIKETFDITNLNAFSAILYRLTVVQGNTPWRVWDLYKKDVEMPNYWKTLLSVFGDKVLSLSGIDRQSANSFSEYHYSAAMTDLVRRPGYFADYGYNVTATAFSDGVLIGGGFFGIILIGMLAGYLTRLTKTKMILCFNNGNFIGLSLVLVFFTSYLRAWLNSGGISTILHISLFVGLWLTYLFLKTFEFSTKIKPRP